VITDKGETINELVGLTTVFRQISIFKNSGIELGKGIKVNQFLETSVQNIRDWRLC
jgi:hypothetical protein